MKSLILYGIALIVFAGACSGLICEVGTQFTAADGTATRNKVNVVCPNVTDSCFRGDATFVATNSMNTLTGTQAIKIFIF